MEDDSWIKLGDKIKVQLNIIIINNMPRDLLKLAIQIYCNDFTGDL